jgi:chromosome segregation ATPase
MLGFLSSAKTGAIAILLVLALSGVSYGLYQKAEKAESALVFMEAEKASVEAALKSSNEAIVNLNNRIKEAQRAAQELSEANTKLTSDFNQKKSEFESHIGRLENAFSKHPKLMTKLVNRSFDKFIDEVSCNSGDKNSCKD